MRYPHVILATLAFTALLVILIGVYLFGAAERLESDTLQIAERQQTLLLLEQVLSATKDVETSQRGFVLTGDESYLEPYKDGLPRIENYLRQLQHPLSVQKVEYEFLQGLVKKKLSIVAASIEIRRQKGFSEAQLAIASKRGKIVMDSVRAVSERIRYREEQTTAEAIAKNKAYFRNSIVSIVGGSAAVLFLLTSFAATMYVFLRYRAKNDAIMHEQQIFTQSILNTVPSLMLVFDVEKGGFQYVNTYFEQLLGYTPEEMMDLGENSLWSVIHPDDVMALKKASAALRVAADNMVYEREYRIRHKDGSWRSFTDRAVVFRRDENGKVKQLLAFLMDITARVHAEEERKRSEALLSSIINTPLYGIVVVEAIRAENQEITDFRFILLNDLACRRLQRTQEEILQSTMLELYPSVRLSGQFDQFCQVVNSGESTIFESPSQVVAGEWISHACSKLNDGLVITYYDVSDRKAAEKIIVELNSALADKNAGLEYLVADRTAQLQRTNRELLFTNQQLEETNKELEAFSYSVSHDLRAPLRTVNGFAEMLRERYGDHFDEEALRLVGKISQGAQRMGVLIDELLALSRLGRKVIQFSDVNMTELVQSVVADLNLHNELSAYTMEISPLPNARCDAALLRQVWVNLLSNAVKYSRLSSSKIISVTSFVQNEYVVYAVRDEGIGFDMRYAEKLFNVFQRLHKERDFEGTGIGLAIVKRIITKHGGSVWVDALPEKGATFFFSLLNISKSNQNPTPDDWIANIPTSIPELL